MLIGKKINGLYLLTTSVVLTNSVESVHHVPTHSNNSNHSIHSLSPHKNSIKLHILQERLGHVYPFQP